MSQRKGNFFTAGNGNFARRNLVRMLQYDLGIERSHERVAPLMAPLSSSWSTKQAAIP